MKIIEKKDLGHVYVTLFFLVISLLLISPLVISALQPVKADICPLDESGLLVPNYVIEGTTQYLGRAVVIERGQGKNFRRTFLAACGKGGCPELYERLKPLKGNTMIAGFCGTTLISVTATNGIRYFSAYPKKQAELDLKYSGTAWLIIAVLGAGLFIIVCSIRTILRFS